VLSELVSQLRALELVLLPLLRQFLLAQGLAGDPAENGAEGPADRGAHDGGCDARYLPEKRGRALREAAYAAKGSAKELITFQLAGQLVLLELLRKLVLFPLVLLAFMLLELNEACQLLFEFQFAFICGCHDDASLTWRCLMQGLARLARRASRIFQGAATG
jgi:hypothetical protein